MADEKPTSKVANTREGKLAVFWYTGEPGNEFIGPAATLRDPAVAESREGRCLELPYAHAEIWDQYNEMGPHVGYRTYPRGRIVFKVMIHKFVVQADGRIVEDAEVRQKLLEHYQLPPTTIFEVDACETMP